jgi:hypothetical protein
MTEVDTLVAGGTSRFEYPVGERIRKQTSHLTHTRDGRQATLTQEGAILTAGQPTPRKRKDEKEERKTQDKRGDKGKKGGK